MMGGNNDFTEKLAFKSPLKCLDMEVGKYDVLGVLSGQTRSLKEC